MEGGYESYGSYEKTPLAIELERSLNDMRDAYAAANTDDTLNVWLGHTGHAALGFVVSIDLPPCVGTSIH